LRTVRRGHGRFILLTDLERHMPKASRKVNGGESRASLQQSFVTLNKRIAAAAKKEQKGLKLLGLA
jgi:hypothetical protein